MLFTQLSRKPQRRRRSRRRVQSRCDTRICGIWHRRWVKLCRFLNSRLTFLNFRGRRDAHGGCRSEYRTHHSRLLHGLFTGCIQHDRPRRCPSSVQFIVGRPRHSEQIRMCIRHRISNIPKIPYNIQYGISDIKPRCSRYKFRYHVPQKLLIARNSCNGLNLGINLLENHIIDSDSCGISSCLFRIQRRRRKTRGHQGLRHDSCSICGFLDA